MPWAYEETPEDRALTAHFRWYNGRRIDTRWSGGWLTPSGTYYPVDYKNGVTHESIAEEHGELIDGSGSIATRPPIMRIFDIACWMRIIYMEFSTFCVELKGNLKTGGYDRQQVLIDFVLNYRRFESYFINDMRYRSFGEFIRPIMDNIIEPKFPDAKLEGESSAIC